MAGVAGVMQLGPFDPVNFQSSSRRGDLLARVYDWLVPLIGEQATSIVTGLPAIIIGTGIIWLAFCEERRARRRGGVVQGEKPYGDEVDSGDPFDLM